MTALRNSLLLLLAPVGCFGPLIVVGGMSVHRDQWEKDAREVRQRAAFELQCPGEQLQLVPLVVSTNNPQSATQIGVTGCSHRLVYVHSFGWVLNSSDAAPK